MKDFLDYWLHKLSLFIALYLLVLNEQTRGFPGIVFLYQNKKNKYNECTYQIFLHTCMHPYIYFPKVVRKQNAYTRHFASVTTMTHHQYYTCSNKSRIMAEYKADSVQGEHGDYP